MEQRTIEILQVLLALINSATFNCDTAGARKITIAVQAAEVLVEELSNPRIEEDTKEEATDE